VLYSTWIRSLQQGGEQIHRGLRTGAAARSLEPLSILCEGCLNSSGYVACVGWSLISYPKAIHSSTSYSSISILKYSATCVFSASAHSESSMKRTAPSRPRSPALGLSPLAATGVSGCSAGAAPLSLSLSFGAGRFLPSLAPLVGLESLLSSTQCVYRGNLWASASLFSGMRTVRNRSGGKCGPTVVELRLCVYNSSRSKRVSGFRLEFVVA
jgi:hypothetical protein